MHVQRRKILDSRNNVRMVPPPSATDDPVLRRIRANLLGEHPFWPRVIWAVIVGLAAGWIVFSLEFSPADRVATIIIATIVAGFLAYSVFSVAHRRDVHKANVMFTQHRICVCCAYDLKALPEDEDNCVTCPECGAAWCFHWRPDAADAPKP